MLYALAPWSWNTDDQEADPYWELPGAVGLIDLRTVPQMGTPGPVAQGFAFAAFPNLTPSPPGSIPLGDGLSRSLTQRQKNNIKAAFGLGENIVADDLSGVLRELLVHHADPTGQTRFKPLMPTVRAQIEIHLGGHSRILSEAYDPVTHPLVLEVVREDYRRVREETLGRVARRIKNRDPEFHRCYLQALVEKYQLPFETFIPVGLPVEAPLPHGTTLGDTFVDGSDTSLDAHTATGPNSGFSWTEVEGDYLVVAATDRAESQGTVDNSARADSDLASTDHFSESDISRASGGGTRRAGSATRFAASATTYYRFVINLGDDQYQIAKLVTGTKTELFSTAHDGDPNPDDVNTLQGESDGSGQELFWDTVSKLSGTDTAITGNVRVGIVARNNSSYRHDVFKGEDLGAVAAKRRRVGVGAGWATRR